MMINALVISVIAGAAIATPNALLERSGHIEVLKARQLSALGAGSATACSIPDNIISLVTSLPTPPLVIEPLLASMTDSCNFATVTGAYASPYNSYTSQLLSFYSANSGPLISWASTYTKNCPAATNINIGSCSSTSTKSLSTNSVSASISALISASLPTITNGNLTSASIGPVRNNTSNATSSSTRTGSLSAATSASVVMATGAAHDNVAVSFGAAAVAGLFGALAML